MVEDKSKVYVRENFDYKFSDIKTISVSEIGDYVLRAHSKSWDILKIEPIWDTKELLNSALSEIAKVPMRVKDPEIYQESYAGVSIQKIGIEKTKDEENYNSINRNSVPGEPIYTRLGTLYFTRQGFSSTPGPDYNIIKDLPEDLLSIWKHIVSKPGITAPYYLNEWATTWPNFLLKIDQKNIIFSRGRHLKSTPDQYAKKHQDGEARLHIPITTNSKCFFRFFHENEGNTKINAYHLPATGDAYLFNAYVPHDFANFGDTERIHTVFGITYNHHVGWKYYQPHFKTLDEVYDDYIKHLKTFKNAVLV